MARVIHRLTALAVGKLSKPGMHADGGGLYLHVSSTGAKSWIYRYMLSGRRRDMGLGPLSIVPLAEARQKAADYRRLCHEGTDPLTKKKIKKLEAKAEAAKSISFQKCVDAYIKAHTPGWKNAKHIDQWTNTLRDYAGPVMRDLPIQSIDLPLVLKVLEPIWLKKPETASRLRGRIESVLDWAAVRGYRTGENPARWRGHLESLMPKRGKVMRIEHHPALPYKEIAEFLKKVREDDLVAARSLEFVILTASRTSEVIGAKWAEFDLKENVWTIPGERMKSGREHRVPLASRAKAILVKQQKLGNDYVFPGKNKRQPLSNMAMLKLLQRLNRSDLTVHGFRSTFRDWAAEQTDFPREVAEAALAHVVGDKVEAAYRRGDLFEKRRGMMESWATYCGA
ncbi:MAG: integrase arm-type DNA-binding domain-containing protein [Alphaproteobacteria bacterium]|nr:integrase arm-type DNA-binding domain-containing protein [Alphaproteobacteria bacterium]